MESVGHMITLFRYLFNFLLKVKHVNGGSEPVNNELLKGHLGITKELLAYHSINTRLSIGSEEGDQKLLKVNN